MEKNKQKHSKEELALMNAVCNFYEKNPMNHEMPIMMADGTHIRVRIWEMPIDDD